MKWSRRKSILAAHFFVLRFSLLIWSGAMKLEQDKDPGDFAEIWRNAEKRRSEEIGGWVNYLFERRPLKTSEAEPQYPQGKPALG